MDICKSRLISACVRMKSGNKLAKKQRWISVNMDLVGKQNKAGGLFSFSVKTRERIVKLKVKMNMKKVADWKNWFCEKKLL